MNKTPIITIVALLIVVMVAFSGCEFEINLNGEESNTETSVESVVVTDEEGSTQIETIVHYITTEPVPVVTIVEVTNNKGEVVETEKITLSPEEVQQGKDFFNGKDDDKGANKTTEKETEISKEPASDRITTVPENENVTVQDDFAVLNSSSYLIEGRIVTADGVTYPYKIARDGNRFTLRTVADSEEVCIIMGSEYVYWVSPPKKTYVKFPKDLADQENNGEFDALFTGEAYNLYANKKEVDTYTEKMYGVKYRVVEYDDGTLDYFNGKTLVQTVSSDGSTLYYDVISPNVSEGLFVPPADYTEEVITSEKASELAESLSTTAACTDPSHNH